MRDSNHLLFLAGLLLVLGSAPAGAADHPDSAANCADCHAVGSADPAAPKVMPEPPGFFAKLVGSQGNWGHASVSCAGNENADGTLSGCHRPEARFAHFLTVETAGRPADSFCGRCHTSQTRPGAHHPTYKADKDNDGVVETLVRPGRPQEVYERYAPLGQPAPVARYPDALVITEDAAGQPQRLVALPLQTTLELEDGAQRAENDIVTCITCHNPHYGYLVEVSSEAQLDQELVARSSGDALLRLRDYDNALCEACH